MGRFDGKVAFITGAARGQGRAHAVRLASEGADIIAIDICDRVASNVAPPATDEDLAETVKAVEALDRRCVASIADVRNLVDVQMALDGGVAELGGLDVVVANAGVWTYGLTHELSTEEFNEVVQVNLTGVFHTCKAAVPLLIEQGRGGSITITSSVMGLKSQPHVGHYAAAKHGVVGLMKSMALELAPHRIRVNTVNPGVVSTDLIHNPPTYSLFAPHLENPTSTQVGEVMNAFTALDVPWVEPEDIAAAVAFLASDDARYITGISLPVDAGSLAR
jgi:SDR family mycofactocin-dependent oxidoreductase